MKVVNNQIEETIGYILSTADEINLDKELTREQIYSLRDNFLKSKIKRQLKQLMNHTDLTNRKRGLPDIIVQ